MKSPDGTKTLNIATRQVMVGGRIIQLPTIAAHFLDASNQGVQWMTGCWISNARFLVSVWEHYPSTPLILEFNLDHKHLLVGAYRAPTIKGLTLALEYLPETAQVKTRSSLHLPQLIKLKTLRKHQAQPLHKMILSAVPDYTVV